MDQFPPRGSALCSTWTQLCRNTSCVTCPLVTKDLFVTRIPLRPRRILPEWPRWSYMSSGNRADEPASQQRGRGRDTPAGSRRVITQRMMGLLTPQGHFLDNRSAEVGLKFLHNLDKLRSETAKTQNREMFCWQEKSNFSLVFYFHYI